MKNFLAYRINQVDGKVVADFATLNIDDLTAGEVIIRVSHSTINYKDALAATGSGHGTGHLARVGSHLGSAGNVAVGTTVSDVHLIIIRDSPCPRTGVGRSVRR